MTFWVYENWVAESKAVIHRGYCGHCKEGKMHQESEIEKNRELCSKCGKLSTRIRSFSPKSEGSLLICSKHGTLDISVYLKGY